MCKLLTQFSLCCISNSADFVDWGGKLFAEGGERKSQNQNPF